MNKSKELSKERIQQIWDYELIKAWDEKGHGKMWHVVNNFMLKVKGTNPFEVEISDINDFLEHFDLKRCLDVDRHGIHSFNGWRTDVIGFVHARCESLSLALMSGEPKPLLLIDINNYKWIKQNGKAAQKFSAMKSRKKKQAQSVKKVRARSLSKNSAWQVVK